MIFFRVNPSDQALYLHGSGCGSAFPHPGVDPCHCLIMVDVVVKGILNLSIILNTTVTARDSSNSFDVIFKFEAAAAEVNLEIS